MDKEEEDGESGERRRLMGREHVYIASGIFPIWNKGEEFFPPPSVFENVIILDRARFFLHSIIYRNFIFNILSLLRVLSLFLNSILHLPFFYHYGNAFFLFMEI